MKPSLRQAKVSDAIFYYIDKKTGRYNIHKSELRKKTLAKIKNLPLGNKDPKWIDVSDKKSLDQQKEEKSLIIQSKIIDHVFKLEEGSESQL